MGISAIDVYDGVKEKIHSGEYSPGYQLVETELAATFQTSRNTVQKVLLKLMSEGLVTIEKNKGAKVRSYTLSEILEYAQIREALEGLIVTLAIQRLTGDHLNRMRAALAQMSEKLAARDLLAYSECNKLFHQVIYDACPNRAAVDLVMSLKSKISKFNAKTILIPGRDQQSFEEHRGILAAIEDRDAQAASRLLREHIRHVTEKIEEYDKLIF